MATEPTANLTFLPWVRQGAAAAITAADTLGAKQAAVVDLSAVLSVNDSPLPAVAVRLRGPADVVGIDPRQVIRTDPRPGTSDFEPNCFAAVEFDRADFPWLFTPARADANSRLRPWLCLVVVRKQNGVTLASTVDSPLPTLQVVAPARPADELPDLRECWAWAHAQAAASGSADVVGQALAGAPELSLSRLVCPRLLVPNAEYIACVVPSFELGRKAGLGLPIADSDLTAPTALAPAWAMTPAPPAQVLLPVYYHWEFRTGVGGDFESLARALELRPLPPRLGRRSIDIGQPGFAAGIPAGTTVDLESALEPLDAPEPEPPWTGPVALAFQNALARIVNEPSRSQAADPKADPLLAPPIYGRWHAGRASVAAAGKPWLDQLNLDPRWRVAAAFATQVIQQQQDTLMASAWDQAAELALANQRLRQLQLSSAVGDSLHARHFGTSGMTPEMLLRIAAPAFGRLHPSGGRTLLAQQAGSPLPIPATRSAMRRIGRQRGPLSRRVAAQGFTRSPTATWVAKLNLSVAMLPAPVVMPAPDQCLLPALPAAAIADHSDYGAFMVWPDRTSVPPPGALVAMPAATDLPGTFRAAAIEHLRRVYPPRPTSLPIANLVAFQDVKQLVIDQMQPRVALAALARAVVTTGDGVLSPTAPGVTPLGTETVMAAPSFPQPMYEALRDLSQELLLPGLDQVLPDTVVGLKTNRRFVEAYMVGLNHEMARELLWRGYPTDQRGTYFAHFWGRGVPNAAPPDIRDLAGWHQHPLADPATGGAPDPDQFVMLMRSSLLRRYPNAVIYLMKVADQTQTVQPIFSGSMQPDVCFFGFPVSSAAATGQDGQGGYYVVIQEHPTEPRFGLDVGVSLGNASHLGIGTQPPAGVPLNGCTWGRNAAHMGGITRRLPVRLAIRASLLLSN